MGQSQKTKLSVQWKRKLGTAGLFAILARTERKDNPGEDEMIMTMTAQEAIALGGILVSEGNIKLREIVGAGT